MNRSQLIREIIDGAAAAMARFHPEKADEWRRWMLSLSEDQQAAVLHLDVRPA